MEGLAMGVEAEEGEVVPDSLSPDVHVGPPPTPYTHSKPAQVPGRAHGKQVAAPATNFGVQYGKRPGGFGLNYQAKRGSFSNGDTSLRKEGPAEEFPPLSHAPVRTVVQNNMLWRNRVLKDKRSSMKLSYKPNALNADGVVEIPSEVLEKGAERWHNALVGYFLGKPLSFSFVKASALGLWKAMGLKEVKATEKGIWYFIFNSKDEAMAVLDGGPWHIGSRPILLKLWQPMMNTGKDFHSSIPIWVKLNNFPVDCWTDEGLSLAASAIGIPLHVDKATEEQDKVTFARVCIEISAKSKFPKIVLVKGNDEVVDMVVEC